MVDELNNSTAMCMSGFARADQWRCRECVEKLVNHTKTYNHRVEALLFEYDFFLNVPLVTFRAIVPVRYSEWEVYVGAE